MMWTPRIFTGKMINTRRLLKSDIPLYLWSCYIWRIIKGTERDSPWAGIMDSNVGRYSLGVSMYHAENHEDVEAIDTEAKWKRLMGTVVCLHITDFLGLVPHPYSYSSLSQCVSTAYFCELYSPGPLRWHYLCSVQVWGWNSNVLSSFQNVQEHLDN